MNEKIHVLCSDEKIRYNAYNIVKAFFPASKVTQEAGDENPDRITVFEINEDDGPIGRSILAAAGDIRSLYTQLSEITGKTLPWGLLTGVRPVKLASSWITENLKKYESEEPAEKAFSDWFSKERFVSPEKARLAFDIALREKKVLEKAFGSIRVPGFSVYVSVPFCPSVCSYCSFSSGSIRHYADRVDSYIDALINEMRKWKQEHDETEYPSTLYIGGGTPTSLNEKQFERLLLGIDDIFGVKKGLKAGRIKEYTVEAGRPDSINGDKLELIKAAGAGRISVNPQTMQAKTLESVGRGHTVQQVTDAFWLAREKGFDNINMDLIMGLPGETDEDVADTLEKIMQLSPESLTVHCLALKRSSSMGIMARTGADISEDKYDVSMMTENARRKAYEMGLQPYYLYRQKNISGNYENTGYAVAGKECLYNILMMEEVQSIAAFGAGASSKQVLETARPNPERHGQLTNIFRSENPKNVDEYIKRNLF